MSPIVLSPLIRGISEVWRQRDFLNFNYIFMQEKIIQTKTCKHCNIEFNITDKDLEFYKKVSPKFEPSPNLSQRERDNWNNNFLIPTPTICPDCRQQRRLAFRNERNLYKRKCDATGKNIISVYSPDKNLKVYSPEIWWSDKWNSLNYWKAFNFKKKLFEQIKPLMIETPNLGLYQLSCENSNYINSCSWCKNCYMSFNSDQCEDTIHSYTARNCSKCIDTWYCDRCEDSYELLECWKCFHVFYGFKNSRCSDSYYIYGCKNSSNCFMSSNQENKKYIIFNKQYTKEEYIIKIKELLQLWTKKLEEMFLKLIKQSINREKIGYSNKSVTWDNIFYSHNSYNSYDSNHLENCKHCNYLIQSKDCMDYQIFWDNSHHIYESVAVWNNCSRICFSQYCFTSSNLYYCYWVGNSSNCFACSNLRDAQYCILNKQYTKEEYNILAPKIIEKMKADWEWGEFFPTSLSPFGYNETVAQEYFPINSPLQRGARGGVFNWSTYTPPKPNVEKVIPASKLPENITDIPDDILNWAIECEVTKKPFRIIPQELEFYRKHNIPVPRRHPDQRHLDRMKLRNPRKLFTRDCDKCWVSMQTTYSPEREEIVYCQTCYDKEVY